MLSTEPSTRRGRLLPGPLDVAIMGGGINGAGIARDAALRGKSVILIERHDFAREDELREALA